MNNKDILKIYLKSVSRNQLIEKQYIAEKTIKAYRDRLSLFLKYIDGKALREIKCNDIKDYLADCVIKGIKPSTLKARLSAIKSMFKELSNPDYDLNLIDVAQSIKPIKFQYSHKVAIEKDDLNIISDRLQSRKNVSVIDMRNHIFVSILRFYGLRISGALNIRSKDIHFDNDGIRIDYIGKGNKECSKKMPYFNSHGHLIHQVTTLKEDLEKWIELIGSDYIFKANTGNKWSYAAALKFFKKTCSDCGFGNKGYTPHSTRHSFVSHKLADGVPLQTVSELVDHSNTLITAKIYSHSEKKDTNLAMACGF